MHFDQFDFDLPESHIAHEPLANRDDARLLVLDRASGAVSHHHMRDLPDVLAASGRSYRVVLNDSRVVPSSLEVDDSGPPGGQRRVARVALARDPVSNRWRPLGPAEDVVHPARSASPESHGALALARLTSEQLDERLQAQGRVTWPRYLRALGAAHRETVPSFYNTVYARADGSVAPPSGGINLSRDTLRRLAERGFEQSHLTLHVGHVTFRRPTVARLEEHQMEGERFAIPAETARKVAQTRRGGGRVLAVGTTVTRALEYAALVGGPDELARVGVADVFIRPGHRFQVVDALLTGLQAPRTTLFVLSAAFGGLGPVLRAYRAALARGYRWYTLGDSFLII